MNWRLLLITAAIAVATLLLAAGLLAPMVFAGRVMPGLALGGEQLAGLTDDDLVGALSRHQETLATTQVTLALRGQAATYSLLELGVTINQPATSAALLRQRWPRPASVRPVLQTNTEQLHEVLATDFTSVITVPQNATLQLARNGRLLLVPSVGGEGIDTVTLESDIITRAATERLAEPIELVVVSAGPEVLDSEVEGARLYGARLLREGLKLSFSEEQHTLWPYTVRRLLRFEPQADPSNPGNTILGVTFDAEELREYLLKTIAPAIDQTAHDARFERLSAERVSVFQSAQAGQVLNVDQTIHHIGSTLSHQQPVASLAVDITEPTVASIADIEELGLTDLLATGESDFTGSPQNRIHNVNVGAARYHGLLIAPGATFSFNEHLGPVDGAHGWKPELVIKNNTTTPEYGGGICQVSSTAFRAAIQSGLSIDERRNHSYAVRYYGTPGFDATVYPGYTDLRFTNNTPGYILIQTRVNGTKLAFDFWGTDDGRVVQVDGPHPYAKQSNGAVKATLGQTVEKDGEVLIDQTFYSNYKSPELYPKVLSADDPAGAAQTNANET